uniref:SAP domain-containing protein n=1 Tax=Eucampia antarctica TaxID=49252 RepID=A0A7S2RHR5_9STRA|mmetsp:Transcript_22387/g.21520  ORF Transcript_22387/g.21520 Transcript_22387/m.21520 type:complete len:226 (+) Transcript_22387:37-714(+)
MIKCRSTLFATYVLLLLTQAHAFSPLNIPPVGFVRFATCNQFLKYPHSTSLHLSTLPDVGSMKASELRNELISYGLSTKSFFEKSELVEAVKKAREEGKKTIPDASKEGSDSSSKSKNSSGKSSSRKERLNAEIANCSSMKIGELRKELKALGISTKSFFEKSEFVRALAEARVDGAKTNGTAGRKTQKEDYDSSYRDVVVQKLNMDPRDPRWGGSTIIDIRLKQ